MAKTITRITLLNSKTPLMGEKAESMMRAAANGTPAVRVVGETTEDQETRLFLMRGDWIDAAGNATPKAEAAIAAGTWPPADTDEPPKKPARAAKAKPTGRQPAKKAAS